LRVATASAFKFATTRTSGGRTCTTTSGCGRRTCCLSSFST
jgi:hypothetical protein